MARPTPVVPVDGKLPCNDCKRVLPVAEFGVNRARKCGYDRICRACKKTRTAKWKAANRERGAEYLRQWRAENAERLIEYDRQRYRATLAYQLERTAAYRRANPGKRVLWQQNRVARAAGIENTLTDAEWLTLVAKYGGRCLACGRTDLPLTRDHVIPLTKGGALSVDNVQPLCGPCNSRKHDKVIDYRPDVPETTGPSAA